MAASATSEVEFRERDNRIRVANGAMLKTLLFKTWHIAQLLFRRRLNSRQSRLVISYDLRCDASSSAETRWKAQNRECQRLKHRVVRHAVKGRGSEKR